MEDLINHTVGIIWLVGWIICMVTLYLGNEYLNERHDLLEYMIGILWLPLIVIIVCGLIAVSISNSVNRIIGRS